MQLTCNVYEENIHQISAKIEKEHLPMIKEENFGITYHHNQNCEYPLHDHLSMVDHI